MKKLHILFITVCCVAAIVSCRKTETPVKPETEPEQKEEKEEKEETKTVLYGSLGETTKTYLSPNSGETQFDVYWECEDCITIKNNSKGGACATFWTQATTGSAKTVPFTQKSGDEFELEKDDEIEAFYPAEIYGESLIWPAEQRYMVYSDTPAGAVGNNPMWAKATIQTGTTEMQFYNLGGVIRFKLSKPTKEFKVVKAMISADQPMSGAFTLQEITLESGTKIMKAVISDGSGDVTIIPENSVTISTDGAASFYFAIPDGTYTGIQITLVGEDGSKVNAKLGAGKSLEVKRAEVVRLTAQGITPSMEGSNCFIGEGSVPIVITAMGNAFDNGTALDGNNAKAVWKPIGDNAKGCKVVWETVNTVTAPASNTIIKSAEFANGVLTVVPTGTPGNALVAITDGANGTGNIVWSYHIWVPDTNNSPMSNVTVNGVTFLDRNIGALKVADPEQTDNTKSIGLFYQWGRKDPMLVYCDFNHTKVNGIVNFSLLDNSSEINETRLKNTIENPDKFIKNDKNQVVSLGNLWGYEPCSTANTTSTKHNKTIYDPCPVGYRVASHSDFCAAKGGNNNDVKPGKYANNAASFPSNLNDKLCFPLIASLDYNISGPYDTYMGVWTATIRRVDGPAWMLNISSTYIRVGQQSGGGNDGYYPGNSFNVRCVKDRPSEGYTLVEMNHEYINFFE